MANKKISELPVYTGTSQSTGELAIAISGTTYKITPEDLGTGGASTAYVDAKIEDALVDGVVTKAPSQNVVVDALSNKEPLISAGATTQYFKGDKTWATLDKAAVGLSNVDNTSDANKPISTATQIALNGKQPLLGYTAANNNDVVHISGSETVTGNKTFSGTTKFDGDYTQFETGSFFVKQTGLSNYNVVEGVDGGFNFYDNAGSNFNYELRDKTFKFGSVDSATFDINSLTSNQIFNLPDASGTIALTSDLTSKISGSLTTNYLPKATGSTTLGNSLIFDNGTNVGIGTTNVSYGTLTVAKSAEESYVISSIRNTAHGIAGSNQGAQLNFYGDSVNGVNNPSSFIKATAYYNGSGSLSFGNFNGTSSSEVIHIDATDSEVMRITSTGSVGIGTYAPAGILDVASTSQGSLPFPRMTSAQRTDIYSSANGTHVYQTDGVEGVYVKKSTGWVFAY